MLAMEAVRKVMQTQGVKPAALCEMLNIKSNVLSERFKQKNVSITKLNEMLKLLNYKVILLPSDTEVPENGIEVE